MLGVHKTVSEFQAFITRGNVIDMVVGVIVGGAFGKIVTSLVNDVLMPPIGLLLGGVDFANLYVSLNGQHYDTFQAAKDASAPMLSYGLFLQNVINFLIVALCIFFVVKLVSKVPGFAQPVPAEKK